MAILAAKNIGKSYAKRTVVNEVSLHVASN
ncbi:hypothetical protein BMETH_9521881924, partial [methanotrophic bacterial endosymbiont of Bathymodiolus sp.]